MLIQRSINRSYPVVIHYRSKASYLSQKDIDAVKDSYPQKGPLAYAKIGMKMVKMLCQQGFADAKSDYHTMKFIRSIPPKERTQQQQALYQRIKTDLIKAVPAFTVLCVPMGGPLFYVYLKILPNFTPTWILTEKIYRNLQTIQNQNRLQALTYFEKKLGTRSSESIAKIVSQNFVRQVQSNEEMRMVSKLLIGKYYDGTYWLTHFSPLAYFGVNLNYLLASEWSALLLAYSIGDAVRGNAYNCEIKDLDFQGKMQLLIKQQIERIDPFNQATQSQPLHL